MRFENSGKSIVFEEDGSVMIRTPGPLEISARRSFLGKSALVTAAGALALTLDACAAGSTTTQTVEQVIATIQAWLPFVNGVAIGIAALVPGAAEGLAVVEGGISTASGLFNTLTSTMTASAAKPIVSQIVTDMSGVVTAFGQMVNAAPAGNTRTSLQAAYQEAEAVLPLLSAFITGAAATLSIGAATAPIPVPKHLWIRHVPA